MKFNRHFFNMDSRVAPTFMIRPALIVRPIIISLVAVLITGLLSGCATSNTMYQWGNYQPEVYQYFKGESVDEQIIALEKNLEEFKAHGKLAPPGFHAHLGMLYSQVGKLDLAAQEFTTEKNLFPESAAYINFLMNKSKKKEQ